MKWITYITLSTRILYVSSVFLVIKVPEDYWLVAVLLGIAQLVAVGAAFVTVFRLGFRPKRPSRELLKQVFQGAAGYFLSRAAIATYTSGGTVFLGFVSTPAQVAYYSAAEMLYRGAQGVFTPVLQSLYPYMSHTQDRRVFARVLRLSLCAVAAGVLAGVLVGHSMVDALFGANFRETYRILLVFLITISINVPSSLIGYPFIGALGNGDYVNKTVMIGGVVQVIALCTLYMSDNISGFTLAICITLTEFTVLILRIMKCRSLVADSREVQATISESGVAPQ